MKISQRIKNNYGWLDGYTRGYLGSDFISAIMVTVLLVPQALAYAMLAGLPPQAGIYAAIAPPIAYALFGSSRMLSVGPVAIISIMTAYAISSFPPELRVISAAMLALMCGGFLMAFGLLRGGSISTFFSRPVVTAYISGAALLIILSQFKNLLQIDVSGSKIAELLPSVLTNIDQTHLLTAAVGLGTIALLWVFKRFVSIWLRLLHVKKRRAQLLGKLGPVFVVALFTVLTAIFNLDSEHGLATIGVIPASLPSIEFPAAPNMQHWQNLILSAFLISLVGFVDSVSVAQTLAAKLRQRVDANKELLGLGAANAMAGLTGGYPVAGSLSRSAFNFSLGAKSPLVGVFAAGFMCLAVLTILPVLEKLPLAVLAGLIIHSCFGLFNLKSIWRTWCYSKADALTAIGALLAVLIFGVQYGVLVGTALSMIFHIRLTLKPHTVVVGRFLGTEHYRDVERYPVEELDEVKTLRIDESLYFANARFLEDTVSRLVQRSPKLTDLVLMCPAVNRIDASALQSLEEINQRLAAIDVKLHLSEMHSHVMDRLHRSDFLEKLTGRVFISQHEAIEALRPEPDWSQFSDHIDMH